MENLGILDSLSDDSIDEILQSWNGYRSCTEVIVKGRGDPSIESELVAFVIALCRHGLDGLVKDHFLQVLEVDSPFRSPFPFLSNEYMYLVLLLKQKVV